MIGISGMVLLMLCFLSVVDQTERKEPEPLQISMDDALKDYDYLWKVLEEDYPFKYLAERRYGLYMEAVKAYFRRQIEKLGTDQIDFYEYYRRLRNCIGLFQGLGHLKLYSPAEYASYRREMELVMQTEESGISPLNQYSCELLTDPEVEERYRWLMEQEAGETEKSGTAAVSNRRKGTSNTSNLILHELNDKVAYMKINSFLTSSMQPGEAEEIENWFLDHADTPYIILDICGNSGGNDWYWINFLVAPNLDSELGYSHYQITPYGEETERLFQLNGIFKEDLDSDLDQIRQLPEYQEEALQEVSYLRNIRISVMPSREEKLCRGTFFLLTDSQTGSAADGFAMFCKATGFATVVGQNTYGDGGGGGVFLLKLPESGLLLRFRAWHNLNPDGSSNVEFGTAPDILNVKSPSGGKPNLEACLEYIERLEAGMEKPVVKSER